MPAAAKRTSEPRDPKQSDTAYLAEVGKRVREIREQRDMTRKVLAGASGVSERYLAQLETGTGNASITLLKHVAAALNVRMTQLLSSSVSPERALLNSFVDGLPESRLEEVMRHLVGEFGADEGVRRKRIALIGLRGAGKSTLGSALAKALRRPFVELDREIEQEAGMALAEIFLMYGQARYRDLEKQCLERLISSQREVVVSVGGGVVSEPDSFQRLLTNCFTVWVKASPAEHMSRVVAQGDMRPMQGHGRAMQDLKEILQAREPLYARADAVVDTSGESVSKSLGALRAAVAAPSR